MERNEEALSPLDGISVNINKRHAFVHERVLEYIVRETNQAGGVIFNKRRWQAGWGAARGRSIVRCTACVNRDSWSRSRSSCRMAPKVATGIARRRLVRSTRRHGGGSRVPFSPSTASFQRDKGGVVRLALLPGRRMGNLVLLVPFRPFRLGGRAALSVNSTSHERKRAPSF